MGREMKKTVARAGPTLPPGVPRVRFAAPVEEASAHFEISKPVALIGSRHDCDLFVNHGDVSKTHCALINTGGAIIATDLCTRSGTFVNGQRISTTALEPGDELRVGTVPVQVELLELPDSSAVASACEIDACHSLSTPLRLTWTGQRLELTRLPAVIGRRNVCHVVIDTPDVSLAHALLFTIGGRPAIFDLGSRSGTYLNAERVTLAWLRDGDRLCIGGEELSLTWEGPAFAESEAARTEATKVGTSENPGDHDDSLRHDSFDERESMVARLKVPIDGPQPGLRDRIATLHRREAELVARAAALEQERVRLAAERQQVERQSTELRAATLRLEEDRARLQQTRDQLDTQRAELERQRAHLQRKASELSAREAANAELMRQIEQFKNTLSDTQRAFTVCAADSKKSTPKPDNAAASAGAGPPSASDLPAPLVDQPMFTGLDATSPEQWPPELQERLRFLRRGTGKSEADVMAQVLAEFRAQHGEGRAPAGN